MRVPSDAEKQQVWQAYRDRNPIRVPLRWNVNSRVVVQNPEWNPEGFSYEQVFNDPHICLTVQARFQEYVHTVLAPTCDTDAALPESWTFSVEGQNVHDGAYFGAPVTFRKDQVPCTEAHLTPDDVATFMQQDFSEPLENPWVKDRLAFHARLCREAETFTHLGRKGKVVGHNQWFDGPVTAAITIFGPGILMLFAEDPQRAQDLLEFITRAAARRCQALADLDGGFKKGDAGFFADDSIQLLSTAMVEQVVLPVYELWLTLMTNTTPTKGPRGVHLCGDSTRHFKMLHDRLGVASFDTGFPVDHGRIRQFLGPDVEISGGPHVSLLRDGPPAACAAEARRILQSGVMTGGRFILQEGNNLPPRVPTENLTAVYACCQEHGRY